ncbi:DM13 domain-containing protein [Jidongwangia harbinensis]|uniref:DM13 domain-containing protein n=1 Tax=Jidongwangia harbinensis TaxID=2878561 RepID=UPI001CD98AD4|nr:DM13 domain-containing protein [Jidongwangia harbinensis]MCA2211513.1 DM13 domain-containing protein [Jidongwangia harbinensis]
MIRRLLTRPAAWAVILLIGAGSAVGLYWFQPWRLFTTTTVVEQLSSASPPATGAPSSPASAPASPSGPAVVRAGTFVTHEHSTTGTARLVRNADGSHQLELVGLDTSDGPDLRIWLTDQNVRTGSAAWRVFDDGRHVELGRLKGNRGDQVYPVPDDIDVRDYRSVSVWCKRFSVSFGAAPLASVAS